MNRLNAAQLQLAQSKIDLLPIGLYEASEIYGDSWKYVDSQPREGRLFRASVGLGCLRGIKVIGRNYSNHMIYEITH